MTSEERFRDREREELDMAGATQSLVLLLQLFLGEHFKRTAAYAPVGILIFVLAGDDFGMTYLYNKW